MPNTEINVPKFKPLVILGAGGFARETLDVVDAINSISPTWDMRGFIVDTQYGHPGEFVNEKPILGDLTWLAENPDVSYVCGVGAPDIRYRMIQQVKAVGGHPVTLIHPNAVLTRWVRIGQGTIITAGCILTNQIVIGDHAHINLDCTIGHNAILADYVTLAPGVHVSGNVHLNEGAYLGTGANIVEKRVVGAWSIVGAGSTVVKDIPPNTTAVGVPAQVIKERPDGWHLGVH